MGSFSLVHWAILIIVVMLLFGRGRVSDLMGDFAKGITSFKKGLADGDTPPAATPPVPPQVTNATATPVAPATATQDAPSSDEVRR
jgi:sec-independent protein translocase protein TatA